MRFGIFKSMDGFLLKIGKGLRFESLKNNFNNNSSLGRIQNAPRLHPSIFVYYSLRIVP